MAYSKQRGKFSGFGNGPTDPPKKTKGKLNPPPKGPAKSNVARQKREDMTPAQIAAMNKRMSEGMSYPKTKKDGKATKTRSGLKPI